MRRSCSGSRCWRHGGGASGDVRNAHRKVMAHIGIPGRAPEIDWIEVPGPGGVMRPHPIICPTRLVETILEIDAGWFSKTLEGPEGDIRSFWRGSMDAVVFEKVKKITSTCANRFRLEFMVTARQRRKWMAYSASHGIQS